MADNPYAPPPDGRQPQVRARTPPPAVSQHAPAARRPRSITILAWLFIFDGVRRANVLSKLDNVPSDEYVYCGVTAALGIGLLYMRKWSFVVYIAMYGIHISRVAVLYPDLFVGHMASNFVFLIALPIAALWIAKASWKQLTW